MPDSLLARFKAAVQKVMPTKSVEQKGAIGQDVEHDDNSTRREAMIGNRAPVQLTPMQAAREEFLLSMNKAKTHAERMELQNEYFKKVESLGHLNRIEESLKKTRPTIQEDQGREAIVMRPLVKSRSEGRGL